MKHVGDRYTKLMKNSAIFFIGNFGSKIISFLIVPFYTYVLSTEEYGSVDLFVTSINIAIPFLILGLQEAALRFLVSRELDKKTVASISLAVFLVGQLIAQLVLPFLLSYLSLEEYSITLAVLLFFMSFNQIFLQYLRGIGNTVAFALNGIILTIVTVAANVILLLFLHAGVFGYLLSLVIAQVSGSIEIVIASKLWKDVSIHALKSDALKTMLRYSIPLVPNGLMWWIMNAANKYLILIFCGVASNGLFVVAQKFPTIINTVYNVFMQAWQISAIEEKESEDLAEFQSLVFRYMFIGLAIVTSLLIVCAEPLFDLLIDGSYREVWPCVPILSFANMFACMAMFFGTTYVVAKESKRSLFTTMIGAISNIVVALVTVPCFGIKGAALATLISYILVVAIRVKDTARNVSISYDVPKIAITIIILLFQVICSQVISGTILLSLQLAMFGAMALIHASDLIAILDKFRNK